MRDRFRQLPHSATDAVVIGAGLGGLTAAALLARRGLAVLVVDRHSTPGGRAATLRQGAYEFDGGLHAIPDCGPGGTVARVLRAAGVADLKFRELDPDGFDALVFPDFVFRVPKTLDEYGRRLVAMFPAEASGIERYVRFLREVRSLEPLLLDPRDLAGALATLPSARLALRYARATLEQLLDTCTFDPRLRAVLAGPQCAYGEPQSRASALEHGALVTSFLGGSYYPEGGGRVLANRLAEEVEDGGGQLLLGTRALNVIVEKGRACGVTVESRHLGRQAIRAPIVISNASPWRTLFELAGSDHLRKGTVRRARPEEPGPGLGVLYLGVNRDLRRFGVSNRLYWLFPEYDIEGRQRAVLDGSFASSPAALFSFASLRDPDNRLLAPAGLSNLEVVALAPARPESWGVTKEEAASGAYRENPRYLATKERFFEQLLRAAEGLMPGIRDCIAYSEGATPLSSSSFAPATSGAIGGRSLTPGRLLLGRRDPTTDIGGLFLCGARQRGVHGSGDAILSGLAAAAQVVGRGIIREVRDAQDGRSRETPPVAEEAEAVGAGAGTAR